ncbi:MAG: DUF3343 domain-containing protein [Acetatifactor sp.]
MRAKEERFIVTFYTTAEAMAMEKLCRARDLPGKCISAPRDISADCGIAWSAPKAAEEVIRQAVAETGLEVQGFFIRWI